MSKFRESSKMVHVSTAHLSVKDIMILDHQVIIGKSQKTKETPCLVVNKYDEGFRVVVPDLDEVMGDLLERAEKKTTMSQGIIEILKAASDEGYEYIQFDRNAKLSIHFPIHEWN